MYHFDLHSVPDEPTFDTTVTSSSSLSPVTAPMVDFLPTTCTRDPSRVSRSSRWTLRRLVPELPALVMLFAALELAITTTADLDWPPRDDFYREMGSTQSIMDGRSKSDPAYLREAAWYNPLVPRLVALVAPHTRLPLPTLYTRAGPYFNLLTPLGFYLLVALLFGRWTAVASLGVFLFTVAPFLPPRVLGTYSPWLWTRNFAPGFFFLTAAAMVLAFASRKIRWCMVSGALLGLTALVHTAPALILVLFLLIACATEALRPRWALSSDGRLAPKNASIVLAISFIVASDYLLSLLFRYGFEIKNSAPTLYVGITAPEVLHGVLSVRTVLAIIGGIVLVSIPSSFSINPRSRNALVILFSATFLPLTYGMVALSAGYRGIELRQVVPAFHFHIYFTALQAIFAGIALRYAAQSLVILMRKTLEARRVSATPPEDAPSERFVLLALIAVVIIPGLPGYLSSYDLRQFRFDAIENARRADITELYRWALRSAAPDDVFLVDPLIGLRAISSAGRKVVVLPQNYSNPYVDYDLRKRDADLMYRYLRGEEIDSFLALASRYEVRYVVAAKSADDCCVLRGPQLVCLRPVFNAHDVAVYEVSYPERLRSWFADEPAPRWVGSDDTSRNVRRRSPRQRPAPESERIAAADRCGGPFFVEKPQLLAWTEGSVRRARRSCPRG